MSFENGSVMVKMLYFSHPCYNYLSDFKGMILNTIKFYMGLDLASCLTGKMFLNEPSEDMTGVGNKHTLV